MSKEEFMKIQTCVLKVNIHCDGCKQKVKKILQRIEGVFTTKIDADQGKVTVSGSVDPSVLIKKLAKSGKHAEIWGAPKANNNPNQSHLASQFKGMQIDNGKGGGGGGNNNNNKKGQKNGGGGGGGGGGNSNAPKMGQQLNPQQIQQLQKMKGFQDLKLPPQFKDLKGSVPAKKNQNQKGVKFDVPEDDDDDFSDDEFDDEFTDDDDDEFDDLPPPSKMKPNMAMMPNAQQMMMNAQKNANLGGGPAKNVGKGVPSSGGGSGCGKAGGGGGGKAGGGGGGNHNQGGGKNGGGGGPNAGKKGNGGGGPMAGGVPGGFRPMGGGGQPNMSMPMGGPMGNIPAVQGLPATGPGGAPPGYFQGAGPDPIQMQQQQQQQQQYLAAVMNQQRAMGNERFQPMMYARPPPAVNYMPPNPHQYPYPYSYPYHPHGNDHYSHAFNDENTSSCDIM